MELKSVKKADNVLEGVSKQKMPKGLKIGIIIAVSVILLILIIYLTMLFISLVSPANNAATTQVIG